MSKPRSNTPGPNDPSVLNTVAKDLNRSFFHGSRIMAAENQKFQPYAIMAGQQVVVADKATMKLPVRFEKEGLELVKLTKHEDQVDVSWDAAKDALNDSANYFQLESDILPRWLATQKTLSLPEVSNRAPEDTFSFIEQKLSGLRIPPAVLGELEASGDRRISLCRFEVDEDTVKQTRTRKLVPMSTKDWRPALLLRCPVVPAMEQGGETPIVELKGIPQGERWYLDSLGLLPKGDAPGNDLPVGCKLTIWLEEDNTGELSPKEPLQIEWTLSRRNLTHLARPGMEKLTASVNKAPYPFWADTGNHADTLRLLQMASITNNGGYFLRVSKGATSDQIKGNMTLVVVLQFEVDADAEIPSARKLPLSANAISYATGDYEPEVVRLEGNGNQVLSCYGAAGCVNFGFRRKLPKSNGDLHDPAGFAAGIQLLEYGVYNGKTAGKEPIVCFIRGTKKKCDPDLMTPLSPLDELTEPLSPQLQSDLVSAESLAPAPVLNVNRFAEGSRLRRLAKQAGQELPEHFYYRTSIRYACASERGTLYQRLKSGNELTVKAGFRDIFGNVVRREFFSQTITLYYTDALISPLEWPKIEFQISPLSPSGTDARVELVMSYSAFDRIAFYPGDVDLLQLSLRLANTDGDEFAYYLKNKLSESLLKSLANIEEIQGELREEIETKVSAHLNALLDNNLEHEAFFDEGSPHVSNRLIHAKAFLNTGVDRRRRNRSLLEAGLGSLSLRTASHDPEDEKQQLRRLQEVREQLIGVGDGDVEVTLQGGKFTFSPVGVDLREKMIVFLDAVIASPESGKQEGWQLKVSSPPRMVAPFSPELVIKRDKKYLPPELTLKWAGDKDGEIRERVQRQIAETRSKVPLALQRNPQVPPSTLEFKEVASQFLNNLGRIWHAQVGILRNRFNEHELWFVHDVCLPSESTSAPVFQTPSPLSNQLFAGRYSIPDFSTLKSAYDEESPFASFEKKDCSFTKVDLDVVGRRIMNALESGLLPQRLTGSNAQEWGELLAKKDGLARQLALTSHVVPIFREDAGAIDEENSVRMCNDLFLRDLRNFYRTDTLVQVPVMIGTSPESTGLRNFYGRIEAKFVMGKTAPGEAPTEPAFSDFVLSYENGPLLGEGERRSITVGYDLPPGKEGRWRDWEVVTFKARLTHIQFGEASNGEFSSGQWLELVDSSKSDACSIDLKKNVPTRTLAIPAIVRRFPAEPLLQSVATMPVFANLIGQNMDDHTQLSKWDWRIDFAAEGGADNDAASNDKLILEIEYPPEPSPKVAALRKAENDDLQNLGHCMLVLDEAADMIPKLDGMTDPHRKAVIGVLAHLLSRMEWFLEEGKPLLGKATALKDYFELGAAVTTEWPGSGNSIPGNDLVNTYYYGLKPTTNPFSANRNAANADSALHDLTISSGADPSSRGAIPLFGSNGAMRFKPSISVVRNSNLISSKTTTDDLVYKCGPVVWQSDVEVRQVWKDPIEVRAVKGEDLERVIRRELEAVFFGVDVTNPFPTLAIRIELRHAFRLGSIRVNTPFMLLAIDQIPNSISNLARKIAVGYCCWLTGRPFGTLNPDSAARIIDAIEERQPTLSIGLQVSTATRDPQGNSENGQNIQVGRVMLEIESLEFPMSGLTFPRMS